MKAVMYHYVREGQEDLPYFRYLHRDDFRRQLDMFQAQYVFPTIEEFRQSVISGVPIENGMVLTFDDGLKDHLDVTQELVSRGLWGIFYVPTGCYHTGQLLNVHRIHMLLGRFGGVPILSALQDMVKDGMIPQGDVIRFHDVTYGRQENDAATTQVKKILNYSMDDKIKNAILDQLMMRFFKDEAAIMRDYYLTDAEIKSMHEAGMVIGAHSVNHPVFSKLPYAEQKREISECFGYLENIVGDFRMKTFCYPYGGDHVFTAETMEILNAENVLFSFNVEQRDIEARDLQERQQALPRFDCNQFPHGQASMGMIRPEKLAG